MPLALAEKFVGVFKRCPELCLEHAIKYARDINGER